MARDVRLELNRIVNRELAGRLVDQAGAGTVAADLVKRLRAEDPALLAGWLQTQAVTALAQHIARRHPAPVRNGPGPEAIAARRGRAAAAKAQQAA
jgi:hypothetical protein